MSLIEQIESNLIAALKSHDEITSSTLRLLKSAIKNKEILLGKKLDEIDIQEIIGKEIKQRRDSIDQYQIAERDELVNKEQAELEILQKYLPKQLTEEEITQFVEKSITNTNATSMSDMGKVMAALMPDIKGKADGSLVSKIVKEKLNL